MPKEEIIKGLKEYSKELFFKMGNKMAPMVFFIKDDKAEEMGVVDFKDDIERIAVFEKIGRISKQKGYNIIVIASEMMLKTVKGINIKDAIDNFDTERPSTYPKNMRRDGLMLSYIDFSGEIVEMHFMEYEDDTKKAFKKSEEIGANQITINSIAGIVLNGYKDEF